MHNGGVLQPLPLWRDERPDYRSRIVANANNRVAWLRARAAGVTATDAAQFSSDRAVLRVANEKLHGRSFTGNAFTEHGREREPELARWAQGVYGIEPSADLFHAEGNRLHLATPDGIRVRDGRLELAEIKTTTRPWRSIPRNYLRQVWWQQYVLGAERTLVVWEQHDNFVPVDEPQCRWVDRDDDEIRALVGLADRLLEFLRY